MSSQARTRSPVRKKHTDGAFVFRKCRLFSLKCTFHCSAFKQPYINATAARGPSVLCQASRPCLCHAAPCWPAMEQPGQSAELALLFCQALPWDSGLPEGRPGLLPPASQTAGSLA